VIEVFVARLGLDGASNTFVVILQEQDGDRIVPIWIGRAEAEAIAANLNGVTPQRPMTHDLCKAIIDSLGATLEKVHVTRVLDTTFFAELHLERGGEKLVVDARPSDCIAIAIRCGAPIFAAGDLLAEYESSGEDAAPDGDAEESAGSAVNDFLKAARDADVESAEQLKRHLEQLRPEDFGKFTL
jgi:hypothetical protein